MSKGTTSLCLHRGLSIRQPGKTHPEHTQRSHQDNPRSRSTCEGRVLSAHARTRVVRALSAMARAASLWATSVWDIWLACVAMCIWQGRSSRCAQRGGAAGRRHRQEKLTPCLVIPVITFNIFNIYMILLSFHSFHRMHARSARGVRLYTTTRVLEP